MAHALLLSPATRFDSPDSSSGSLGGASSLSPATPPPPSLDFLEDLAGLGELDTPSRAGTAPPTHSTMREGGLPSNPLPEWLTDELGHDWLSTNPQSPPPREEEATLLSFIQDDDDEEEERDSGVGQATAEGSTTFLAAPPRQHQSPRVSLAGEPETPAPNRFPWQSQPRVPSSLRHGFTAASSPSTSVVSTTAFAADQEEGGDEHTRDMSIASALTTSAMGDLTGAGLTHEVDEEEAVDHSASSAGSNSVVVTSVIDRGSAAAGRGDNEQLQAAVRALKGPNGGLFAAATDAEQALVGPASSPQPKGLLGLFQPPSPPQENNATPLPKSTRPAPSLSAFTFSAPDPAVHTSSKDLEKHLSPPSKDTAPPDHHDDAHRAENEATPVARPQLATPRLQGAPPASSPTGAAAVGKRERFLKRSLPPSSQAGPPAPQPAAAAAVVGAVATPPRGPESVHAAAASETESSDDDDPDDERHFGGGAMPAVHLADDATGATTTTDEEDHSSTDDDDDEEIRSGGMDGALLLGESKPGMGWSSDEDEDQDQDQDERGSETEPVADDKVHADSYLSPGAPQQQQRTLSAPRSPARVPLPSVVPPAAPAVSHASVAPPSSPFKLFQPIYDTVTRSHLAALVDEIDTLDTSAPAPPPHPDVMSNEDGTQPPPPPPEGTEHAETSDEGFLGEEGEKRSSKRIRLSPRGALERIEESPGGERQQNTENSAEEGENNRSIIDAVTRRRTSTSRRSSGPISATRRPPLSRRRRDTYLETERIMDRVRRKENEAHLHDSPSTRSMLRISGPRPPPLGASASHESSVSPPTLPKLAAAASASIRSALGSSVPPSPSLSHGLPSFLNEQRKGSSGRRQFARTPVSQARKPRPTDVDRPESSSAPSAAVATPPIKAHPQQNTALTHLHPQSSTTQRLLASAGSSARDKGLVFDAQQGRWIRTRRSRVAGGSAQPGHGLDLETSATEEEDLFRDLSESRSDVRSTSALAFAAVPRVAVPPTEESTRLNLSGLGITEGTPPLPTVKPATTLHVDLDRPSPGGRFASPPVEVRPADEHPDGPQLQLESEDSATWGRDELEHKQSSARRNEQPSLVLEDVSDSTAPVDDSVIVESSMLNLYRRAHATQDAAEEEPSTRTSPPASSKKGRRDLSDSVPHRNPTQPPRSALKNPRSQSEPVRGTATPIASRIFAATGPPRSVSFSDGKTSGKIEGLVDARVTARTDPQPAFLIGTKGGPGSLHFEGLETQSESEAGGDSDADRTITRVDASTVPSRSSQDPKTLRNDHSTSYTSSVASSPSLSLTGSRTGSRTFVRTHSQNGNATFLTECSFGVSHDRLLQYITDVEPFEPNWEDLRSIDLSGKKAEGVVRLKEFLPNLDEVNLNDNEIAYLTGIPPTLRTLLAASNRLTDLTSFQHLSNLERLDISNNQLESVRHLACLRHLRELKADNNRISNLDGLADLDSLVRISLKNNDLSDLDFSRTSWTRLETLHLARNRISNIRGFERLQSLLTINLDHNRLTALSAESPMPRLRILRVCQNPLPQLDVAFAPRLRTLYADSAQLGAVQGVDQLNKLENLSVRDQSGGALTLSMPHLRDVKRLYLSGNPLPRSFPSEKFFNLVYLELAMCQLSSLADNLAAVVPNVRVLNLNHNFLSDLSPLSGLTRCTRLSLVGARVAKARHLAAVLSGMPELEVVDVRMNPLTLAFYPPLVPSGETLLPAHAEHRILHPDSLPSSTPPTALDDPLNNSSAWLKLDTKFRRSLPDEWYHRRAAYRAVLVQSVPALSRLDGIDVAKERGRLAQKLEKLAAQPA